MSETCRVDVELSDVKSIKYEVWKKVSMEKSFRKQQQKALFFDFFSWYIDTVDVNSQANLGGPVKDYDVMNI